MSTKKQSLLIKKITLLVFFVILFLPQISLSAINTLKPAGAECASTDDESCLNKECETADDGKYYCTCDADSDCPLTTPTDTGLGSFGETWDCVNGSDRSRGLNYCLSTKGKVEYAIPPKFGQSVTDLGTDPSASTVATLDEIKNLISAPQPRITIPGLKFSNQDLVKAAVREEGDGTYLYIPYFGEYVSAVYRYLVVAISILAVMRILHAGFNWMVFSDQNGIAKAKKHIIGAVMGLIIILSSYLILYLINPNLVEFKNLRIKYIEKIPWENIVTELVGGDNADTDTSMSAVEGIPGKYRDDMFSACGDKKGFMLPTYEQRLARLIPIIKKWKEVGVDQGGAIYTRGGSWNCNWFNIDPAWAINVVASMAEKIPGSLKMNGQCLNLARQAVPLKYKDRVSLITGNPANKSIASVCSKGPNGGWYIDYKNNFVEKAKNNGLFCGDCSATMRSMYFVCFNDDMKESNVRFDNYRPAQDISTCKPRGAVNAVRYIYNPTHKPKADEVIAQLSKMKPGDIISWQNKGGGHIIMYTGNGGLPYEILEMGGGGADDVGGGSGGSVASKNIGIPWKGSGMRTHQSAAKYIKSFATGDKCVFIFRPLAN